MTPRKCVAGLPRLSGLALVAWGCAFLRLSRAESAVDTIARSVAMEVKSPTIRWRQDPAGPGRMYVEVNGVDRGDLAAIQQADRDAPDWGQRWLVVSTDLDRLPGDSALPSMVGTYALRANSLQFIPQFPLEPGVRYRAVFIPREIRPGFERISETFVMPRRALKRTTVLHDVFPSADVLPENLLKFYLLFSAPMSGGNSYDHIHLQRENGSEVEVPFLRLEEELWDPKMRRLTVLIDPGRIKRGVQPNERLGPSVREGSRYTLVVDAAFKDATGAPLQHSFRKSFRVGPTERSALDPATWRILAPKAGTREALMIQFPKPMDYALAKRVITVVTQAGVGVPGEVRLSDHERRWRCVPAAPWSTGPHQLVIQTTLEDLAGNNIGKAFEVDVFEHVDRQVPAAAVMVPFNVRQ